MTRSHRGLTLGAVLLAAAIAAAPSVAQTIAIVGGTVHTAAGAPIENGTVLIVDGRITAVGANVTVPADARRIDARGKRVTPGLINAGTQLGLVEISAVAGTREGSMSGNDVAASFNVLEGINPASQLIPVTRVEGITTAVAGPGGGLIAGQAVAIDLAGVRIEEMVIRSPVAMIAAINEGSKDAGGGARAGVMARLRRTFDDAREYDRRRAEYRQRRVQDLAAPVADLEALLPVLRRELPIVITAHRRSDIENALRLADEYQLRLVLQGAREAWQVADRLAQAGVPVVIDPLDNLPSYDAPSPRLDNAALLARAGVAVVLSNFDSHNARTLRQSAGNAVAHGMAWDAALRSVSLDAARALGIQDAYGSIEVGKVANVVVWDGDLFELSTAATNVLIRGREIDLTSRQRELLRRYRTLPPRY